MPKVDQKCSLLSHQELLELDILPMSWIMNLVIPNPGLVVISGKPGSFKTFFAFWLGLRASAGLPLFDEYDTEYFCQEVIQSPMGKVPTLFVEEEVTKQLMKERAHGFKVFEVGDMNYMIDEGFTFTDEAWLRWILKVIQEKGIKLLILDPFSSVMGLEDENNNAQVAKVMDLVRKEFVKLGLTVIMIHHPSKGDGDGKNLRGAGDILGKCDVHLCLEVENEMEKIVRVSYQKLRVADRARVANFKMSLTGDGSMRDLRFRYLGETKTKTEEERGELESNILEVIKDGEEWEREEVAKAVGKKTNSSMFDSVWSRMLKEEKISKNATSKKYYRKRSSNS
jgi:hypothetical protein